MKQNSEKLCQVILVVTVMNFNWLKLIICNNSPQRSFILSGHFPFVTADQGANIPKVYMAFLYQVPR